MPITESRIFGHLLRLVFVILWVQTLFPVVSAEVLPYLEPVRGLRFMLPQGMKNDNDCFRPVSLLNIVSP